MLHRTCTVCDHELDLTCFREDPPRGPKVRVCLTCEIRDRECVDCSCVKPVSEFRRQGKHSRRAQCISCENDGQRDKRAADPNTAAKDRRYYQRYRASRLLDARQRYAANPRQARDRALRRLYGITVEDYDRMFADQSGACLLCDRTDVVLVVDHDHDTGAIRGLLCHRCNLLLGQVEKIGLTKFARYLAGQLNRRRSNGQG
jgi:hypothetical protein